MRALVTLYYSTGICFPPTLLVENGRRSEQANWRESLASKPSEDLLQTLQMNSYLLVFRRKDLCEAKPDVGVGKMCPKITIWGG